MKRYNVAVVGATGAVGEEIVSILNKKEFPVKILKLFASDRSIGKNYVYKNEEIAVDVLDEHSFENIDIALFVANGKISEEFAPYATESGAVVIDATGAFVMDGDIPLVVPEVNPEDIGLYKNRGVISLPNSITIQSVAALEPIKRIYGIKRIVISTYQAASEAGMGAMDELLGQTKAWFEFKYDKAEAKKIPRKIAFNCVPQIDEFCDNGYTKREMGVINEIKRVFDDPDMAITSTCVYVPVFRGHSESVNVETEKAFDIGEVTELLSKAKGCKIIDNNNLLKYPTAIDVSGNSNIFIGRIRKDESLVNGLNMWIVADNLIKGSALNCLKTAEILIKEYL